MQSNNTGSSGNANGALQPPGGYSGGEGRGEHEEEEDLEVGGEAPPENRSAATPSACGEQDEAKVAALVRLLEADGAEPEFSKGTR